MPDDIFETISATIKTPEKSEAAQTLEATAAPPSPEQATQQKLSDATDYYRRNAEDFWGPGTQPYVNARVPLLAEQEAVETSGRVRESLRAIEKGYAKDEHIYEIAQHTARQEYEAKRMKNVGSATLDLATQLPKIAGEFYVGGKLSQAVAPELAGASIGARELGRALAMPSTYQGMSDRAASGDTNVDAVWKGALSATIENVAFAVAGTFAAKEGAQGVVAGLKGAAASTGRAIGAAQGAKEVTYQAALSGDSSELHKILAGPNRLEALKELAPSVIVFGTLETALHGMPIVAKKIGLMQKQGLDPSSDAGKAEIAKTVNEVKATFKPAEKPAKAPPDASMSVIEELTGEKQKPLPPPPLEPEDLDAIRQQKDYWNKQFEASNKSIAEEKARTQQKIGEPADVEKGPLTPDMLADLGKLDREKQYLRQQKEIADRSKSAEPAKPESAKGPLTPDMLDDLGKVDREKDYLNRQKDVADKAEAESAQRNAKTTPPSDFEVKGSSEVDAQTPDEPVTPAAPKRIGLMEAARLLENKRRAQLGQDPIPPRPSGDNAQKPLGEMHEFNKPKPHEKYKPSAVTFSMERILEDAGKAAREAKQGALAREALGEKAPGAEAPGAARGPKTRAEMDKEFQGARLEHLAGITNAHYRETVKSPTPENTLKLGDAVGKIAERAQKFGIDPLAYMRNRLPSVLSHVGEKNLKSLIQTAKELNDAIRADSQRSSIEPEAIRRAIVGELQSGGEVSQTGAAPKGAVVGDQGSTPAESPATVRGADAGNELTKLIKESADEAKTLAQEGESVPKIEDAFRQGIQAGEDAAGKGYGADRPDSKPESADPNAGRTANFSSSPGEPSGLDPRVGRAVDAGPDGLNPVDQAANKQAAAKILDGAFKEFLKGESGAVDLDKLREQFAAGMRNTHDAMVRIFGRSFPALMRASRLANEAVGALANKDDFVRRAQSHYPDIVFGRDATDQQVTYAWTAMSELRARHTKDQHIRASRENSIDAARARAAGDMGAASDYAKRSTAHMNQRAATVTFVGKPGSPFQTESEYQTALRDPYVRKVMQNYQNEYVPFKEQTFRDSQGLSQTDPLNSFTQIKKMPMRFVAVEDPGQITPTTVYAGKGNLANPKIRKNPASFAAGLDGDNYEMNGRIAMAKDIGDSYPGAVQAVAFRVLESEGLGVWRTPGDHGPIAGIDTERIPDVKPPPYTQAAARGETDFYVVKDVSSEFRTSLDTDRTPGFAKFLKALNHIPGMAALASSVEAVSHGTNLTGAVFHPVADIADALHSPMDFFHELKGRATGSAEFNDKILALSKINATKPSASEAGIFTPNWLKELLPGMEKYDPTYHMSRWLHAYDEVVRVSLSDAYDRLVAKKKAPDTDAGKRDFINQWTGNYNRKAGSSLVAFLRESELQPFAVAATTMTSRAVRNLAGSPGISGVDLKTNLQLRASVLARLVLLPVAGMAANYARYGRIDGDDNTPYGAMKLTTGEDGKTAYFDLLGIVGIRRGLNALGIMPYMEARRHGESTGKAMDESAMGTAHALLHTVFGPGPQFLWTAATGKDALGRQVAEDAAYGESQQKANAQAALERANPAYAALTGADEPSKDVPYKERIAKLFGNLGPKFAGERQSPEVREFNERYSVLQRDEKKLMQEAHSLGKQRAQSPILTAYHQAAIELGKIKTATNSPLVAPEMKTALRERQTLIAKRMIDMKLRYDKLIEDRQKDSLK